MNTSETNTSSTNESHSTLNVPTEPSNSSSMVAIQIDDVDIIQTVADFSITNTPTTVSSILFYYIFILSIDLGSD